MPGATYKRVRVLVETAERSFRGYVYVPEHDGGRFRLSDHLNSFGQQFMCLSDVEIADRGQHWRVGEKQPFVAVFVGAITYVTPLEEDA